MTALSTLFTNVRLRIKDQKSTEFSDSDLLVLATEVLDQVYKELSLLESNLTIQSGTIETVASTSTYTLTGATDVIRSSLWITDPTLPLQLVLRTEVPEVPEGQPETYALSTTGEFIFNPVPDKAYTVNVMYYGKHTAPTSDTLSTYEIPWQGIWDRAIERSMVLECLSILERSVSLAAIQAGDAWDTATLATYSHGRVVRTNRGRLFYGI